MWLCERWGVVKDWGGGVCLAWKKERLALWKIGWEPLNWEHFDCRGKAGVCPHDTGYRADSFCIHSVMKCFLWSQHWMWHGGLTNTMILFLKRIPWHQDIYKLWVSCMNTSFLSCSTNQAHSNNANRPVLLVCPVTTPANLKQQRDLLKFKPILMRWG